MGDEPMRQVEQQTPSVCLLGSTQIHLLDLEQMKIVAAAVVAIVVAGIGYTLWARHETTFRYRLTVEVASGGLKSTLAPV